MVVIFFESFLLVEQIGINYYKLIICYVCMIDVMLVKFFFFIELGEDVVFFNVFNDVQFDMENFMKCFIFFFVVVIGVIGFLMVYYGDKCKNVEL